MWIQTKLNYDKHVKRMENWKDINEEEEWASEVGFVILFLMNWEALMLNVMLEFLNTFVIKGTNIYFGYQHKVYVISKQLIVNVFGVYVKGYIKDPNGQVNKSIHCKHYIIVEVHPQIMQKINGMQRVWVCHILLNTMQSYLCFIKKKKMTYFNNKNAITLMIVKKRKKVDWAQIIYNSLCKELDQWYKYVKGNKGDKKDTCQLA
jgi:hypothetical protein